MRWRRLLITNIKSMNKLSGLDMVALLILMIGGLNWGLVGLFQYDLVASIFGDMSSFARGVYDLVGLSAVYSFFLCMKVGKK